MPRMVFAAGNFQSAFTMEHTWWTIASMTPSTSSCPRLVKLSETVKVGVYEEGRDVTIIPLVHDMYPQQQYLYSSISKDSQGHVSQNSSKLLIKAP
jgi:hypothetical protein